MLRAARSSAISNSEGQVCTNRWRPCCDAGKTRVLCSNLEFWENEVVGLPGTPPGAPSLALWRFASLLGVHRYACS